MPVTSNGSTIESTIIFCFTDLLLIKKDLLIIISTYILGIEWGEYKLSGDFFTHN